MDGVVMTRDGVIAIVVAGAGLIGQLINYILNLRLRNAIFESERRVLNKVHTEYMPRETCDERHKKEE